MKKILSLAIPFLLACSTFAGGIIAPRSISSAAAYATFVKKAGDTMSGPLTTTELTVSTINATGGTAEVYISSNVTANRLRSGLSGSYIEGAAVFATGGGAVPVRIIAGASYGSVQSYLDGYGLGIGNRNNATAIFLSSDTATKIGFGTTIPTEKIDIVGNAKISGNLTVDTASNTLVVDSVNHRVGIATGAPATELEVNGTSTLGRNTNGLVYPLLIKNNATGGSADVAIQFVTAGGAPYIGATRYQSTVANDGLFIRDTAGLEIARFTRGGNVGIGTTAPAAKLHVAGGVIVSTAASYGSGGATWEAGGGRGVYATNNSGAALSSGTVVQPVQSLTGLAITTSAANSEFPVGTIYDDSCANGALCRVCTEGICPARLITSADCAITNDVVYTGSEVGRAECAVISAGVVHNQELGNPATFSASNGDVIKIWAHRN